MTPIQKDILTYIRSSGTKERPISGKDLKEHFGLNDTKRVREAVASLRRQGEPICSRRAGYFWPATREEALTALGFMTHDIAARIAARNGMQRGIDRYFALSLFDREVA